MALNNSAYVTSPQRRPEKCGMLNQMETSLKRRVATLRPLLANCSLWARYACCDAGPRGLQFHLKDFAIKSDCTCTISKTWWSFKSGYPRHSYDWKNAHFRLPFKLNLFEDASITWDVLNLPMFEKLKKSYKRFRTNIWLQINNK